MKYVIGWWLFAFAVAFTIDGPVARLLQPNARIFKHSGTAEVLRLGGNFIFVLILASLVWIVHPSRLRGAALLCVSGVLSGVFYSLMKWVAGRVRPIVEINPFHFEPFVQGFQGLLGAKNLSFPSGHTSLAFATAAGLSYLFPKGGWAFYVAAGLVAAERIGELAHYVSDTVAGAAVGILSFQLALRSVEWMEARRQVAAAAPPA